MLAAVPGASMLEQLIECAPTVGVLLLQVNILCCFLSHKSHHTRASFTQQDHVQVFNFILDCLESP